MTNKERYQKTFSLLHASERTMEAQLMKKTKRLPANRLVPVIVALVLALGLASVAYATNLGGIRKMIQIWIRGDQTDAVMEVSDGHYTLTYRDKDGVEHERSGGGVAMEPGGWERPLTAEELMEDLDSPEVEYEEDGSVWVYYHGQSMDITDKFKDGFCRVKIVDDKTIYMTIKYKDGYATDPNAYPDISAWD